MEYLVEHEFGFALDGIGFPSISGCHAIVYLTSNGLFGFHNAGGSGKSDWATRAQSFATFVNQHFLGKASGLHLYGCSFVGDNRRGYPTAGTSAAAGWKDELTAFAGALGFGGSISGYDLALTGITEPNSAYVEYRPNGLTCDISVKQYTKVGTASGNIQKANNHKIRVGRPLQRVITSLDTSGMTQVTPQQLR